MNEWSWMNKKNRFEVGYHSNAIVALNATAAGKVNAYFFIFSEAIEK